MKDDNLFTDWKKRLLNHKAIAMLVLATIVIGGLTALVGNVGELFRFFRPKPPLLRGSLAIAQEYCPFIEDAGGSGGHPPGTEGLRYICTRKELQIIWPRIHAEALSPSPPEVAQVPFTPNWITNEAQRLHPDITVGNRILRLLLAGSRVLSRLSSAYKVSENKNPFLDEVYGTIPRGQVAPYYYTLKFLARLYPPVGASSECVMEARQLVRLNRELFPSQEELVHMDFEQRDIFSIYRHLLLRQPDPVLRLTLENYGEDPVVVTSIVCDVNAFEPAMDTHESGPLEVLGSVVFELPSQPSRLEVPLPDGPVKLAPKDAGVFLIRLKGSSKGAYRLWFDVMHNGDTIHHTEDIVVALLGS